MEEPLHQRAREVIDSLGNPGVDLAEVAEGSVELARPDHLSAPPELGDHGLDLELALPAREPGDLLLDDRLHRGNLPQPRLEHAALPEVAEDALRERERHRARSRGVRADRRLGTRTPPGRHHRPPEQTKLRAKGAVTVGCVEGVPHLPEDLGLPEDERIEARSNPAEMPRGVLAGVHVEMVDEDVAVDAVCAGELGDELLAGVGEPRRQPRVQLDAVAGLQGHVLDNRRAVARSEAERADALAELDRRRAVAQAEADEALHSQDTLASSVGPSPAHSARAVSERAPPAVRMPAMSALGIDVGGTFTDAVLVTGSEVRTAKVPTNARQEESVIAAAAAVGASAVDRFTHGTTVATNALLERRGARTAFVTNEGFEHLLHLRRQTRAHLYRPCAEHPPPLVPLERCHGVRGRDGPNGELTALDLSALGEIDAEAIAICLLFSFRDPRAELELAAELRHRCPDALVVASHEVAPEFREYERASTTVVDAYLGPVLSRYLGALASAALRAELPVPLVMRSSGGVTTLEEAAAHASFALLSGPAAGVVGAGQIARLSGFEDALAFDMGGTSTDVCAIVGGSARREHERLVAGHPVRLPTLAVHTVGAGGGSIVRVDEGGALRVGPESAGAHPGPACYGQGGRHATVTDANLLLGRLPAVLPGGIELDADAARHALDTVDPAAVVEMVDAEMTRALRLVSVEQGLDPREFALVAFGGAGPLHACALAEELGMTTVLVPAAAGVLSAVGLVAADERRDSVRSYVCPLEQAGELPDSGEADLRYAGQSFELTVPLGPALAERFHDAHEARYGYADRSRTLELVAVRTAEVHDAPPVEIRGPSLEVEGPAVLELDGATAWVPKGWAGATDAHGTLVLERSR